MKDKIELVKQKTHSLFKKNGIIIAYLFGSIAKEREDDLSDIDIAILTEVLLDNSLLFRARMILELMNILETEKIDLVLLNESTPELNKSILRNGIIIYENDKRKRVEWERRTILEYLDTDYLYKMYYKGLKKNILEGRIF